MEKLKHEDLYSLEEYDRRRSEFRVQVMAHKRARQVQIGPHARLYFEDRLTMHYQVQEMLRTERIFERAGVEEELGAYNPLIPDGNNWKATFMIEYDDVAERQANLAKMIGIENCVWVTVEGFPRIWAVADEDLDRATEEKTSAVHFLRFELTQPMVSAVKAGASVHMGIEHDAYNYKVNPIGDDVRNSLAQDLT